VRSLSARVRNARSKLAKAALQLASTAVSPFFVNTSDGRVATQTQLAEAGLVDERGDPPRPWHRIRGPRDASTMWYAVMRKRVRGVFIGALCFRHGDQHASLHAAGWEDLAIERIGV
jgi:hypothetical protein